jgi:dephospho-CoA kinase
MVDVRRPFERVALTGGIATGKSVCLRRFAQLGVPTIDADVVARTVVAPGTPALAAIADRFGPAILLPDGSLNRAALGDLVFADAEARSHLEQIVHPVVFEAIEHWLNDQGRQASRAGAPHVAIADIPLLYEVGQAGRFDRVIVAACRPAQQIERLMARDGSTEEDARRRLAAQWPIDRKRALADVVIDTSGTIEETIANVDRVWAQIVGPEPGVSRHG